jgi:hypothetical protein
MKSDNTTIFLTVLFALLFRMVIVLIFTYPEMLLWNWLMPAIFNLPTIDFWQMFGLNIFISLIVPYNNNSK